VKRIASLLAVTAVVGCSDAFKPTTENVLGDYSVQTFETTDTAGTVNWIQRGATMTITLGPFGVMTGHLFLPGAPEGGGDLDTILIGDWTLTGHTITFDMPAIDTFVRDMPWTVTEKRLAGDHTFGVTRIRVVLAK
jgi:hypothetical protein